MLLIGLSGGISTGKSTVAKLLRQNGVTVIDCDEISKAVTKKGRWGWKRVVRVFGEQYLLQDEASKNEAQQKIFTKGELDRDALGKLVFGDEEMRRKLGKATHLPIAVNLALQILWKIGTCQTPIVVDMPLLFESGFYKWTSSNVVVWCDQEVQISRLAKRDDISNEEAVTKIKSQKSLEDKKNLADVVINNSTTLEDLELQVLQWLQTWNQRKIKQQ
eukprot:TRINITY_DN3052_c1_g1_i1.p1 TRINITY_DN3052_c1_g1~~TRINITY_DN3052_c1_g1_i1.p1  ORF type:complete len:218 (-),score=27.42 TRINITY_DN3052_c1_g1_i1:118-771(-)